MSLPATPLLGHGVSPHAGRSPRRRRAGWVLATMLLLASCTAQGASDDRAPASAALSTRVGEFLDEADEHDKVRAVLVYEGGEPVLELYRGDDPTGYVNLRSVTKSVLSTLIGIAIDEGLIAGVDATLGQLLPAYGDVLSAESAGIRLEQVLTHTAGFSGDSAAWSSEPDAVRAILAARAAAGPGDGSFEYSDGGSHVLSAILDQATGGEALDFARSRLFDPLKIDTDPAWVGTDGGTPEERAAIADEYVAADFAWPTDLQGIHTGWAFMKLRPEDLATFGLLFLDDGVREGRTVVSADWVSQATSTHVETFTTPNGYGYQWWTLDDGADAMYLALGYGGNLVAVVPDRNLVIVVVSELDANDELAAAEKFDESQAITLVRYVILAPQE